MSNDAERAKILARVKKMLNLANDAGASEGERDNAMRMAHATLAKYNLSMAEAEAAGSKPQEERIEAAQQGVAHPWARRVWQAVATLMFCEYFYVRLSNWYVKNYLIGRQSNAVTARELAEFLVASISKEAARQRKTLMEDGRWERSFCKGAADRLIVRCWRMRQEAERASEQVESSGGGEAAPKTPGTAIVLASFYKQEEEANKAFIEQRHGQLEKEKNLEQEGRFSARVRGAAHADKLHLGRSIATDGVTGKALPNHKEKHR